MVWLLALVRLLILAGAVALTAWVMPDVSLEGGVASVLLVALLISLVNVVGQLIVRFLPMPNKLLLLALLTLALNGLLIWVVSAISDSLTVDGFLPAVGAALLISIFSMVLDAIMVRFLPDAETGSGAVAG